MPTITEHAQAYARAKAAGDNEAAAFIHQQLVAAQQAQDAQDYNPTSGMSGLDKALANLGAGFENFGLGTTQLLMPKALEHAAGITDESLNERRARDENLAQNTTGGKALQIAGEALPMLAIPGGVVGEGLGAIPKAGTAIRALGVGSRALPTIATEGAVLGGLGGAITPTTSNESAAGNAVMGAVAGGALPGAIYGLGKGAGAIGEMFSPTLQRSALARKLADSAGKPDSIDVSPQAQRDLQQAIRASDQRVVDAPQSLATLTQDPAAARLELAARANPETAATWTNFDQTAADAKWKALHDALGNDASVQAAKDATDNYAKTAIPEVMKSVNPKKLATNVEAFQSAVQGRLNSAIQKQNPNSAQVYGYVKKALSEGDGSAEMLWNVRKTLSSWLEGTPPPGLEGTRGAKMDAPIMETRKAIDNVLNDATGKRWSKFLDTFGDYAKAETAQKAGQNIRNTFFDETLARPQGATTSAGNPAVTRARLEQALRRFGKNDFGETLDYAQRNVIDQTLNDLHAEEILQRAKSSMTGKGGSQTAPLTALMQKTAADQIPGGKWLAAVANFVSGHSGQQQALNRILQSPQDALLVMRQAERINRPLSTSEKRLVQAARGVLASPSTLVLMNKPADQPGEQPRQ